jgi:hypothetical protein
VEISARVVRRRPVRDRVFEIGVEFSREVEVERFVPPESPSRALPVTPQAAAHARAQIAELASTMKQMAEEEAPLNELFGKIEELVRLCDSARPADET